MIQSILYLTACIALAFFPLILASGRAHADIAQSIICALFLLHCVRTHTWQWARSREIEVAGLLWAYIILRAVFTPALEWRYVGEAFVWFRFILFYAAIRYWLLTSVRAVYFVSGIAALCCLFFAVDAYVQYIYGTSLTGVSTGGRLTGMLTHPNIGNLLLKPFFILAGIWGCYCISKQSLWPKILWLAVMLSVVMLVPLTGERSITLLLMLGLVVLAGSMYYLQVRLRKWLLIVATITIIAISAVAGTQPIIKQRADFLVLQLSDFWASPYGQLFIVAEQLHESAPWFGAGYKQFREQCTPENMQRWNVSYCDIHPHNFYLEWWAQFGWVGLILFVLLLGKIIVPPLYNLWKNDKAHFIVPFVLASVAVLVFPIIVTQSLFASWPAMLFWYSLSLTVVAANYPTMEKPV